MTKAIFLDWFNTLARFEPAREQLHSQAFQECGVKVSPEAILRGLLLADRGWFEENIRSKVADRSPEEQAELGVRYEQTVLGSAGLKAPRETLLNVLLKVQELYRQGTTFALFDDVLSTLKTLKAQGFILGLLTNVNRKMDDVCRELGLGPYLDFIVTSQDVKAEKPQPPVFFAALERAEVNAFEAVHVGDQYNIDVVGARGVGINPILIDRFDLYPEVTDCPRIRTLPELAAHLKVL
ncbi:HAD family hydrolase [Chloroflexota bacterium]